MTDRLRRLPAVLAVALLAACGSATGTATMAPATASPSAPATEQPIETPEASVPVASGPVDTAPPASAAPTEAPPTIDAAWAQTELTDVATGDTFRIADFAGKTVIVETMAIWCTKCLAQQGEVYAALEQLDPDKVAYVLLDVDPSESASALADYRANNEFSGMYAIADSDTARALIADFGDQVVNPPSTPMILIGTDGSISGPDFSPRSADAVLQLARDHGA